MYKKLPKINFQKLLTLTIYLPKIIAAMILLTVFAGSGSAALPQTTYGEKAPIPEAQTPTVFGVEETPIYIDGILTSGLNKLTNSKTLWVRGPEIVWSDIEAIENNYDWSKMQPALNELDEILNLGYMPIVIVRGTPAWAQIQDSSTCGPITSTRFDEFGDFIQEVMDKLDDEGMYVQFWEIWNEPDIDPSLVPADSPFAGIFVELLMLIITCGDAVPGHQQVMPHDERDFRYFSAVCLCRGIFEFQMIR